MNNTKNKFFELEDLIQNFPAVFQNADISSIDCVPIGWQEILKNLCEELTHLLIAERATINESAEEPLFSVLQIKEKFGGLRFYFMMNTENKELYNTIQRLVDIAEDKSYDTCQVTGKPGFLCKKGFQYMTLSEETRIAYDFEVVSKFKTK